MAQLRKSSFLLLAGLSLGVCLASGASAAPGDPSLTPDNNISFGEGAASGSSSKSGSAEKEPCMATVICLRVIRTRRPWSSTMGMILIIWPRCTVTPLQALIFPVMGPPIKAVARTALANLATPRGMAG